MNWLLGRKSQLSLANKLLLYKCVLKPVRTYGVQLWGCAKPSHTQIIQRLQSKILRSITDAPWYGSNLTLYHDLHIPFVVTEIRRLFHLYHHRLASHHNPLVAELAVPPLPARRLKRKWPTDLINWPNQRSLVRSIARNTYQTPITKKKSRSSCDESRKWFAGKPENRMIKIFAALT